VRRVFLVLLIAATLAACGRESQKPSVARPSASFGPATSDPARGADPVSTPPSIGDAKAAFVRDFNAICREAERRVNALDEPTSIYDVPPWLRGFISIIDDLQGELRALVPPPADAEDVDTYLDGNDEQIAAVKAALPEVEAGAREDDAERVESALDEAFTTFDRIAAQQEPFVQRYGLTDCGEKDPGPTTQA
jgi:hypothetical protein